MNQLFICLCLISVIVAIAAYKKCGIWLSLLIAITLPVFLHVIAIIILLIGGDK